MRFLLLAFLFFAESARAEEVGLMRLLTSRCRASGVSCTYSGVAENAYFSLLLRPGDDRAELRDSAVFRDGESNEFSLEFYLPDRSVLTVASLVIVQFKAENEFSPPVAFRLKNNGSARPYSLAVTTRSDFQLRLQARPLMSRNPEDGQPNGFDHEIGRFEGVELNRWHKLRLRVISGQNGRVEAQFNDQNLLYTGPVAYRGVSNYMKFGPYDHSRRQARPLEIRYRAYERR